MSHIIHVWQTKRKILRLWKNIMIKFSTIQWKVQVISLQVQICHEIWLNFKMHLKIHFQQMDSFNFFELKARIKLTEFISYSIFHSYLQQLIWSLYLRLFCHHVFESSLDPKLLRNHVKDFWKKITGVFEFWFKNLCK